MISFVMLAWRIRFMSSVNSVINSQAFVVAASIAVMRAACSAAADSSRMRKISVSRYREHESRKNLLGWFFVNVIDRLRHLCALGRMLRGFCLGVFPGALMQELLGIERQQLLHHQSLHDHALEFVVDRVNRVDFPRRVNFGYALGNFFCMAEFHVHRHV